MVHNPDLQRALTFFDSIGLSTRLATGGEPVSRPFLREVWLDRGVVVYSTTVRVADLFHEAGHLAVTPKFLHPHIEPGMDFNNPSAEFTQAVDSYLEAHPNGFAYPEDPGCRALLQMGEAEAIAWSYAAMVAAGVHLPSMWRRDESFDGEAPEIRAMLEDRAYSGISGMQAAGMTTRKMYPQMLRWLQNQDNPPT